MPSPALKLELPRSYGVMAFAVLLLFSILGIWMITTTVRGGENVPPPLVIVFWCAIVAWNWFVVLGIPYRIEFNGRDDITFISLRKTVRTSAASIESVKSTNGGIFVLRYDGGKVRLLQQFTGFYKLLAAIEAANPSFETRGI